METKTAAPVTAREIYRAKVISALVNAAQLRFESVGGVVLVIGGEKFAHVDPLIEDVSIGLGVPRDTVELALREAVQQQLLVVPAEFPVSEHTIRYVRPNTL